MKTNILISIFMLSFILASLSLEAQTKETREVEKFTQIGLAVSADLYIVQGAPQKVVLEGDADDLKNIVTKVSGSGLEIEKKKGSGNLGKIKIYIIVTNLEEVSLAGSGDVYADGTIKNDELELNIAGSGNMYFKKLEVDNLELNIAGNGNISVAGKTVKKGEINIAGSGNIESENLEIEKLAISVAGSGDVNCNVSQKLKASIAGSGDIYYSGKAVIDVESVGSGKVKSKE